MPNTNVFTGMDGAITVAVDDAESVEGSAANAVAEAFGLAPIGRATDEGFHNPLGHRALILGIRFIL